LEVPVGRPRWATREDGENPSLPRNCNRRRNPRIGHRGIGPQGRRGE
jgi:hypothetical protein